MGAGRRGALSLRRAALGATEIGLKVIAGNDAAIRSYAAAGFQLADGADRPDVLTMRREL